MKKNTLQSIKQKRKEIVKQITKQHNQNSGSSIFSNEELQQLLQCIAENSGKKYGK